jgi:hypothetical protein
VSEKIAEPLTAYPMSMTSSIRVIEYKALVILQKCKNKQREEREKPSMPE